MQNELNTIQRIIEIPLDEVISPKYDANIERFGDHADTCFICGKRTKNNIFVHYLNNGNIVSYGGDDIEGSQGFFPIGPDCAKKLSIKFTFKS